MNCPNCFEDKLYLDYPPRSGTHRTATCQKCGYVCSVQQDIEESQKRQTTRKGKN